MEAFPEPEPVLMASLVLVLAIASLTDLRARIVPNRLTLAAALFGLGLAATGGAAKLGFAALTGLAVAAPLLSAALVRPEGMGMGDVKLVGVLGIYLGWQAWPALLGGLFLAGLTGVLISLGTRTPPSQVALPLVPFLALGALPVIVSNL
jgi:leader peptidase (prepilin peptidase)/N-methyltransferase